MAGWPIRRRARQGEDGGMEVWGGWGGGGSGGEEKSPVVPAQNSKFRARLPGI